MGIITRKLWLIGRRGKAKLDSLFDTGSHHCLIEASVARTLAEPDELPEPKRYEAAVGSFTARHFIVADVVLGGKRLTTLFKVVPHLTEPVILGADFLQAWHVRLDPRKKRIILDPKALRLKAVGARLFPR